MNGALSILIVEDCEDASQTLRTALEIQGHQVWIAADALRALDAASARSFDAAVIDIGLPGMDGRSLARMFRSDLRLCGMPLVALSGRDSPEDMQLSRQAGFDAHLAKPVTTVYLLSVIKSRIKPRAVDRPSTIRVAPLRQDAPAVAGQAYCKDGLSAASGMRS